MSNYRINETSLKTTIILKLLFKITTTFKAIAPILLTPAGCGGLQGSNQAAGGKSGGYFQKINRLWDFYSEKIKLKAHWCFLLYYNRSQRCRVAAKMFVFVLLQNGREIFNFVLCEIFLEFREISLNTKLKFGRNFRHFAKHEIKIWAKF